MGAKKKGKKGKKGGKKGKKGGKKSKEPQMTAQEAILAYQWDRLICCLLKYWYYLLQLNITT